MNKVGLLLIATGKYDIFLKPLIDSVDKFFFRKEPIDIYIFSDKPLEIKCSDRINIQVMEIKHYPFPLATLYRYKHFDQYKNILTSDYLFYLDVDMRLVGTVDKEILGDIVCVQHPGFWRGGWGSSNCSPDSLAYLPKEKQYDYRAGGFQGGERENYLEACNMLNARIQDDESRNVLAEHNDETHWNWYLKMVAKDAKVLSPSYCYADSNWFRGAPFVKRILALEKDHNAIRK